MHPYPLPGAARCLFAVLVSIVVLLSAVPAAAGQSITLALYPSVPRFDQFVQSIQSRWQVAHPDVTLNVLPQDAWDGGYSDNPSENMDVFVFDATYLNQFRKAGYLSPLKPEEVSNAGDFLPYAINGMLQNGLYSAIPLLGCTDVLFYWNNDQTVGAASSLATLGKALNSCTYTSDVPPDRRGLMIRGKPSSNSYRYVQLYYSQHGAFPPEDNANLDPQSISNGRTVLTLGSFPNATYKTKAAYPYTDLFSQSYGRTMVGYTEAMSAMTPAMRANVKFKPMLYSDQNNGTLFFSDVIGINSRTKVRALAVELANMLASTDNVVASIGANAGQSPQYLMPTRRSVFRQLNGDPLYAAIETMVSTANPVLYALGTNARDWLSKIETPVDNAVWAGYQCGCDVDAGPVGDYAQAQQVCPTKCQSQGGWNGQWTNRIPGHQSVCGCNVCPVP